MTDRELLELAAKAAGIADMPYFGGAERGGYCYYENERSTHKIYWNPLTDDGDALRLAVKLSLTVIQDKNDNLCAVHWTDVQGCRSSYKDDPYAATRRAIVRAAAEIGKELK